LVSEYLDAGQIRLLGISDVKVEQIEAVRRLVPVAAVQNEYNLSERRHDDVVDYCEREGILFVPYRPLRGTHPAVPDIARSRGATPSQIALAWLLHRSPAILPIPGTLSLAHLRENLGALDIELTDQELAALA
jgi:pyridoxine 4-dehydrogenase